jgi:hypothetical protein
MIREINSDVVKALRVLNEKSEVAQAFFDWAVNRQKDTVETRIDRLAYKANIDRRDAIDLSHQLEDIGCGKFIVGRRGGKSRIQWNFSLRSVAEAAKGQAMELQKVQSKHTGVEEEEDEETSAVAEHMIRHGYQLRPDIVVTIDLPEDFSKKEAERLAAFVQSLPFEN